MNCEPNEEIPMHLSRKILTLMPKSFPDILSYADYEAMNEDEIKLYGDAAAELKNKMLHTAENLIVNTKQFRNFLFFSELFYIYLADFFVIFCFQEVAVCL